MDENDPKLDTKKLRKRLEIIAVERIGLSEAESVEFSFHMTDWMDDMQDLSETIRSGEDADNGKLYNSMLRFLLHAPAHIVAAATMMTGESRDEVCGKPTQIAVDH